MKHPIENLKIYPVAKLKSDDFSHLLSPPEKGGAVVTLQMPMEKKGSQTRKNPIIFKNALKKASEMLSEEQREAGEIGKVLKNLEFLEDAAIDFWQHQQKGLALIIEESGAVTAFQTPFELEEFVWVGKRPRLGRLIPLTDELRFYVLALDLNKLRLFEASRWAVDEIEIIHGPSSLDDAMKYDDPEKSLQHHSSGRSTGSGGKVDAVHHGQGGNEDAKPKNIRRYFEMVDKTLADHFSDKTTPLVLFGPDSEVGEYREVNSYPHLVEDDIRFNPSNQSDSELEKRMLDWVKEKAVAEAKEQVESLDNNIGQGLGSADFAEVIKAAFTGKVATLFVKKGASHFGTYDAETHTVTAGDASSADEGEDELIEAAVMHTAAAGGRVRYVGDDDLEDNADIAAAFRY